MSLRKNISLVIAVSLLIATILLIGCGGKSMQSPPPLNFFGITDHEKLNDITLTIYAMDPSITGLVPVSVENLMKRPWGGRHNCCQWPPLD